MPSVSVLYINDEVVSTHLELLRNICEPTSKAKPHVTVRYFDKLRIPERHLNTTVGHIDVVSVGSFGLNDEDSQLNKTVYIRCHSDELLHLEHKPLFPTSEFHITIYDGLSEKLAKNLYEALQSFDWNFRVSLPPNTHLTAIKLKSKSKKLKLPTLEREYRDGIKDLYSKIAHEQINYEKLIVLGIEERVELVKKVCRSLMAYTIVYPKAEPLIEDSITPYSQDQTINNLEVHLTPPELAGAITKYAVSFLDTETPINFGDPSVGTGAFYAALLQNVERHRIQSAIGVDISPKQVQAAKWRWESKNMQVLQDDYLHMEKLPHRNLILANPPYMRHQGIPVTYKLELRQRASVTMGMKISGLSGQYVYFLLLSHQWMDEGAIAAWLIPSEFMQTLYGEAIREYLSHRVTLLRIHQFNHDDPQFENADVLPCVVVFKNIKPSKESKAILSIGGTLESPAQIENVIISDLNPHIKWTIPLRSYEKYNKSDIRIKDLFNIKRGIATGANDFFILNKSQIESNKLPDSVFTPIIPKIRSINGDTLEADDRGNPITEQQLFVLNVKLNQDEIKKTPRLEEYLSWGEQYSSRTLLKSRRPWYKQEIREPAPFLCTYMGRGDANTPPIRFIWNKSKAIATNNYLMLYPNPKLKELLVKNQDLYEELFDILKQAARNTLLEFARIHAGGLNKIEPNELREVRLMNLPDKFRNAAITSLL